MLRKVFALFCLVLFLLPFSACGNKTETLETALPRENVTSAKVLFRSLEDTPSCTFEKGSPELTSLLNALYSCQPAERALEGYSPELRSTHRVVLSSAAGSLTLYYDEQEKLYSFATYANRQKDDPIMTYKLFAATLTNEMNAYRAMASVPFLPVEEPPLEIDAALRADIAMDELKKEGTLIDFQHFNYNHADEKPLYSVMTYRDRVAGLENGYLLFVAAWGQKPTGGYIIDISSIEENDSYYVVHVWHDTPVEGADVSEQETQPVSAALVDARNMKNPKIIVFVSEQDEILGLYRIDREFLNELPADMPQLATPDPYEGDTQDE